MQTRRRGVRTTTKAQAPTAASIRFSNVKQPSAVSADTVLQIPKGLTILRPELDGTLDDILRRREFAATPTIPIVGITADPLAPRSSW